MQSFCESREHIHSSHVTNFRGCWCETRSSNGSRVWRKIADATRPLAYVILIRFVWLIFVRLDCRINHGCDVKLRTRRVRLLTSSSFVSGERYIIKQLAKSLILSATIRYDWTNITKPITWPVIRILLLAVANTTLAAGFRIDNNLFFRKNFSHQSILEYRNVGRLFTPVRTGTCPWSNHRRKWNRMSRSCKVYRR